MIEAHSNKKDMVPEEMTKESDTSLPYAILPPCSCIFFVTYQHSSSTGLAIPLVACISDPDELVTFCDSHPYYSVHFVSPRRIDGKDNWQVDKLVEIWNAEEPDTLNCFVSVYVTPDKTEYCNSVFGTSPEDLINKNLITRFKV